ncbi:copper chaperone PCu(A)C [Thioalkalicoccus limnaeus]|uniref:Copper chaperone PCu(A)C n=1 Tax=Thioalkalicoccus limnaeus TaxID=120681 RepID=A0ABV4BI37_9GAMM
MLNGFTTAAVSAAFAAMATVVALIAAPQAMADAAADVAVEDPYVRAVPPGQPNSAAFMVLRNNAGDAHAVVGARSAASKVVELHSHVEERGMMTMRRVESIEVPALGETKLEPGGLHVMLIGLGRDLVPGEDVELTVEFEDGSEQSFTAPVRAVEGVPGQGGGHSGH